jgi:hypothetical protein
MMRSSITRSLWREWRFMLRERAMRLWLWVALAASVIARASSTVRASGFSQMMCLPALAAAMAISACTLLGVQISTTSISGRATTLRQSLDASSKPKRRRASSAAPSVMSTTTLRCGMAGAGQKNIGIEA